MCGASNAELNIHEIYRSLEVTLNAGQSYRQEMLRYAGVAAWREGQLRGAVGVWGLPCWGVLEAASLLNVAVWLVVMVVSAGGVASL